MGATEIKEPAAGGAALLILDMINTLDFDGADKLRPVMETAADAILHLRAEADRLGVPVIYVNDNHGQWHSDRERIVERALDTPGGDLVARMRPRRQDFFVIKPQFSGFYATNLPVLLPKLEATRLMITGVAADICVLFTAADAHMRAYQLWVPSDAVASSRPEHQRWALQIMQKAMDADVRASTELSLRDWIAAPAAKAAPA